MLGQLLGPRGRRGGSFDDLAVGESVSFLRGDNWLPAEVLEVVYAD